MRYKLHVVDVSMHRRCHDAHQLIQFVDFDADSFILSGTVVQ